jgi:hypothetical protein
MRCALVVLQVVLSGCSTGAPAPTPSSPPTTTQRSAFCLHLTDFQLALVAYVGTVGKAAHGEPVDFAEARRLAGLVEQSGTAMGDTAPPDIAEAVRKQLDGVRTSAARIGPNVKVGDLLGPLFGKETGDAREAVLSYRC